MLFTSSHCNPLNVFFHHLSRHFEMHQKRNLQEIGETFCCILVPVNGILNNEEREPEIPNMLDNNERHEHDKTSFLIRPILQEIEES